MATKDIKTTVSTRFEETGAAEFQRKLDAMYAVIEKLPQAAKEANSQIIKNLEQSLRTLAQLSVTKKPGDQDLMTALKNVTGQFKVIQALDKGVQFFKEDDLKNIKSVVTQLNSMVKAAKELQQMEQIKGKTFGLDATTIREADKVVNRLKDLKAAAELPGNKPFNLFGVTSADIEASLQMAQFHRKMLVDQKSAADQKKKDDAAALVRAKEADAAAVNNLKNVHTVQTQLDTETANKQKLNAAQNTTGILNNLKNVNAAQTEADAKQARMVAGLQADKLKDQVFLQEKQRIAAAGLQADILKDTLRAQKEFENDANKEKSKAASQDRAMANRLGLSTGGGAASLMLVQAAVMANSAIINGVFSALRGGVGFSIELEAAFKNLQAVTATTRTEMVGLQKTIKDVAADSKFSATEVAGAALILGQAGLSAKQIAEAIEPVVRLATAAGTTIANAVDLVTSVIGVFDKGAGDIADIANKVTQAANSSKISVEKLALGLQYAGNIASELGISFEETTAALSAMANAGIKSGSTMGTGLRQFLVEVQKPSVEFLNTITRLGLSLSDLDFKSNGLIGVITKLKDAGFIASDAIKGFDVRGAAAFNALIANPAELQKQYDDLLQTNAAVKASETQMESLKNQAARLTNVLGNLLSTGLEPVQRALTALVGGFASALTQASNFTVVLQLLGTVAAGVAVSLAGAWIGSLLGGLVKVAGFFGATAGAAGAVGTALGGLAATGATIAAWATGIGAAITVLSGAFFLYKWLVGDTKSELDKFQAGLDTTKGSIQEKEEAVKSLTAKINELNARQSRLTDGSGELRREYIESNQILAKWGGVLDVNNTSLAVLVQRLTEVRDRVRDLTLDDLRSAANQARLVAESKSKIAVDSFTELRRSKELRELERPEFLRLLTPMQREAVGRAVQQTKSATGEPGTASDAANLAAILSQVKNNPTLSDFARRGLETLISRSTAYGASASDANAATATVQGFQDKSQAQENMRNLRLRFRSGNYGADWDTAFNPNNAEAIAKQSLSGEDAKDPMKLNAAAKAVAQQQVELIEQVRDRVLAMVMPGDTTSAAEINRMAKTATEKSRDPVTAGRAAALTRAKLLRAMGPEGSELRGLDAQLQRPGGLTAAGQSRYRELLRNKHEFEFSQKASGLVEGNDDYKLARAEMESGLRQDLENFQDKINDKARRVVEQTLAQQVMGVEAMATANRNRAKENLKSAAGAKTMEELQNLAQEGLDFLGNAEMLERYKLKLKQEEQKSKAGGFVSPELQQAFNNENAALREQTETAAASYLDGYQGLVKKVVGNLDRMTLIIKKTDNDLAAFHHASQDRLYAGDAGLRANSLARASATGPVSGLRVTEANRYLLERRGEGLSLDSVTRQLEENRLEQDRQRQAKEATQAELRRLETAKATTSIGPLSSEEEKLKAAETTKGIEDGRKEVEKLNGSLNTLRETETKLIETQAGLKIQPETEASWDTFVVNMKSNWKAFSEELHRQDVNKMLADGMLSTMRSTQGGLATFFTDVVTRTRSVGDAFRNMSLTIIKAMLDILAQVAARNALQSLMGLFGFNLGGASSGGVSGGGGLPPAGAVYTGSPLSTATGGYFTSGGVQRTAGASVQRMAGGGPVRGGIPYRDSVPILAMAGEFMVKKKAVDALGIDFMHDLNASADSTMSRSTATSSGYRRDEKKDQTINMWVVTPDQAPPMGPNDIVAVVTDNISRGGSIKQLVKSVQLGG